MLAASICFACDGPTDSVATLRGQSVHTTKKSIFDLPTGPDYMLFYQKNIEAVSSGEAGVREQIRLTAIHELRHYFGMHENQLKDGLENDWTGSVVTIGNNSMNNGKLNFLSPCEQHVIWQLVRRSVARQRFVRMAMIHSLLILRPIACRHSVGNNILPCPQKKETSGRASEAP